MLLHIYHLPYDHAQNLPKRQQAAKTDSFLAIYQHYPRTARIYCIPPTCFTIPFSSNVVNAAVTS